ncbi:hypothetical protein HanRHA438_Chr13g0585181 [Helianthus annuus]|nr:hypothetical protein HanHA300_Chr13g0470481 [Helianthus annuus]KAJ0848069.1 hypothetical protein HanPSC8_Chr13g0552851 [Helianthus annuus]KAJ0857015.1 hypothetical protein HanRHA438_Chr13g0585181 [Helianthus annuus]
MKQKIYEENIETRSRTGDFPKEKKGQNQPGYTNIIVILGTISFLYVNIKKKNISFGP